MPTSSYSATRDSGRDILQRIRCADNSVELAVVADGGYFRVLLIVQSPGGKPVRHDTVGMLDNGEVAVAQMLTMHAGIVALQGAGFALPTRPALRVV